MVLFADDHLVFPWATVGATSSLGIVPYDLTIFPVDVGSVLLITASPAPETNHLVELLPLGEGIVGSMNHHEIPSTLDISDEGFFGFLRPGSSVVIGKNHVVLLEVRVESGYLGFGHSGHFDGETAGGLEGFHHDRRASFPIVVVLSVDKEHLDLGRTLVGVGK